jgi:hypothetical protein
MEDRARMVGVGATSLTSGVLSASQTSSPFRYDRLCLTTWLVKRGTCAVSSSGATVMRGFSSGGSACFSSLWKTPVMLLGLASVFAASFIFLRCSFPAGQPEHWQGLLSRFERSNQRACGTKSWGLRYCLGPPVGLLKPEYSFWVEYATDPRDNNLSCDHLHETFQSRRILMARLKYSSLQALQAGQNGHLDTCQSLESSSKISSNTHRATLVTRQQPCPPSASTRLQVSH